MMTEHALTTWLLTYAAHAALFAVLAAAAERTRWGSVPSRRDALWKLALVGGVVTATVFLAAGSAPSGAAVRLSAPAGIAPAIETGRPSWLAAAWIAITAVLALRAAGVWYLSARCAGRRRAVRRGPARAILDEILGPQADRVTLTCSRTLAVPVAFTREICVPVRALRELPRDELRALLAHEAAHVVRRDTAWLIVAAAVRTLGWWQPCNLFAAARLRVAMELCCDERAAAGPRERAALARCLVRVAEWSVHEPAPAFAAMASRGSALRRRLESLLDDGPRRDRRERPWRAVSVLALPAVCLAPVVTVADFSRVIPAVAVRLITQVPASEAPAAAASPSSRRAGTRPSPVRLPAPVAPAPIPAPVDREAVSAVALDAQATPSSTAAAPSPPQGATPAAAPGTLRDAIAAARFPAQPATSGTRLEVPEREQRGPSWVRRIGADLTRPKLDTPSPDERARSRFAQYMGLEPARQK